MLNRHIPDATLHLQNIMMFLSFVPSGISMISHALKSHFATKGIFFAGGILITGVSVTLAYDTHNTQVFLLFGTISLIGWIFLIASFLMFKNEIIDTEPKI